MQKQEARIDPVERWLFSVKKSSRKPYRIWWPRYLSWCHDDPQALIEKAKDVNWLDVHLKQWFQYLKAQGLSSNSRAHGHAAIRSFYRWNNIALPPAPKETRGRPAYESDRIYARDEIRAMYDEARNTREQAIVLFLAHAPQREEVLTCLRWRMISEQIERGDKIVVVNIPAELPNSQGENCNKNAIKYRFAFGQEVSAKILEMIDERREAGEEIGPEAWVFRSYSQYRTRNPVPLSRDSQSAQLHPQTINDTITRLAEKAGIQQYTKTPKMTRALFHAHGFRRYWKATIRDAWKKINAPIDSDLLKFEIGDTVDQQGAYDKFSEGYLREVHEQLEPHLQIVSERTSVHAGIDAGMFAPQPSIEAGQNFIEQNGPTLLSLLLLNQVKIGRIEEEILAIKKRENLRQ